MGVVIELCMRHPPHRRVRHFDYGHGRCAAVPLPWWNILERVALLASLAPQEAFVFDGPLCDPLGGRQNPDLRQQRLAGKTAIWIAGDADVPRVGRDVLLEFF